MSSQYPAKLAYKLRRIRENFRLNYAEMVSDLEWYGVETGQLDPETIRKFELGQRAIPPEVLDAYSKYSGIPLDGLLDDEIQPFFEKDLRLP